MPLQWENLLRGALGMFFLILVCYLLSNNRRAISWRLVLIGIFAQVMFAMGVLNFKVAGQPLFWIFFGIITIVYIVRKILQKEQSIIKWLILGSFLFLSVGVLTRWLNPDLFKLFLLRVSGSFVVLVNLGHKGTEFMFGNLADSSQSWAYVFAIQVLPNIIFFAALSSILYYLGVLQKVVYVFAYLLNKLNISGAESLSTAANIFLGQTEAPLMIRPYLDKMTRSEILLIMVGGMANTAGSVLAAYVGFLGGNDPAQQNYFALHMLSQSIMSAPAAIVCSKILFPQTEEHLVSKDLTIPKEKLGDNFLDALSLGTTDGLKLAVNVGAMLIVFTALMYVGNALLGWIGDIAHINGTIANITSGRYKELSLQMVLGYIFSPVAWLIGVGKADMVSIGQLLGEKTILNEFVAYVSLGKMKADHVIVDAKSLLIATYALSGFANFASIGIQIGGISQLAPNQRRNLTELGVKALIGGTIACLMCGCIAGALG